MTGWRDRLRTRRAIAQPGDHRRMSPGSLAAVIGLAALASVYLAWPVYRAFLPLQIGYSDAWNTLHADVLRAGRPLYPLDYFVANNYPPLSFYLLDALSGGTNVDLLYIGRVLSLIATTAAAFAVYACIRQLGGSRLGAALGAVWWLASMARWHGGWIGSNDPQLVALALMTGALAYALRNPKSDRALLAIALMAVAGFYKHTLVAIPAATLFWLTIHDRGRGLRAAFVGIAVVSAGLGVCGAIFGGAFFDDMLVPRLYSVIRGVGRIGPTQLVAPALIVTAIWAAYRQQTSAAVFVIAFAAIALVWYLVESSADGVADNAAFELTVAAAVGIGCAFDDLAVIPSVRRWGLERSQIVVVCILIARLLLSLKVTPYLLLFSRDFRASLSHSVAIMQAESIRISAIPGPVACDGFGLMACRFAGKPLVFDPFIANEYVAAGRVSAQEMADRISALKIRFEQVDPRVSVGDLQ